MCQSKKTSESIKIVFHQFLRWFSGSFLEKLFFSYVENIKVSMVKIWFLQKKDYLCPVKLMESVFIEFDEQEKN